jgi:hypothetical protein
LVKEVFEKSYRGDIPLEEQSMFNHTHNVMDVVGRKVLRRISVALGLQGGEATMENALLDPTPLPNGIFSSSYLSWVHYLPQPPPESQGQGSRREKNKRIQEGGRRARGKRGRSGAGPAPC